jgi:hypothetical protein
MVVDLARRRRAFMVVCFVCGLVWGGGEEKDEEPY